MDIDDDFQDTEETESDQIEFELWLQEKYQEMKLTNQIDPKRIDIKRALGYYHYLKSSEGRAETALDSLQYESFMRNEGMDLDILDSDKE